MFQKYKPKLRLVFVDIGIIILNIVVVLGLFPLTSRTPFVKYELPAVIFVFSWLATSYFFNRYARLKEQSFTEAAYSLFYTSLINFTLFAIFIILQKASPFSQYVLFAIMAGIFISEYLFLFLYFAYRYAVQYETPISLTETRENAVLIPSPALTDDEKKQRERKITENAGLKTFDSLNKNVSLLESSTNVLYQYDLKSLQDLPNYTSSIFVQLKKLNQIRGINKMLYFINEKLPDDGRVVVCYNSKSTIKKNIYRRFPVVVRDVVYMSYFVYHRMLPKFFLTQRLYYDITMGKKRILSKTEILGRLVFCGFQIEKQIKIDGVNFVIAKRVKQSEPITPRRNYGPFIKLKRHGKNGNMFYVYKMRTMHPYAEFLQDYIYETNSLQEGGKFNKDIRINTLGRFMRKYWLDELPMIFNLIKGDMKLIGVRPLSAHYFSLYSHALQQKRIKYRPGLLPPFYADMPKTLEDIQASEMRYLNRCEKEGVLMTDVKYFFLILKNILFKKAHSA